MPRVKISGGLFTCIVAIYLPIAQLLFLPGPLSKFAGQEAWLAVVIAGLAGLLMGLFAVWVSLRHPGLGPAQIARQVLGKWFGGLVGLTYAGFFTFIFSLTLRDVLDFTQMILLPGTPGRVIVSLFAGICLYGVWHGLEALARVAFQTAVAIGVAVVLLPLLEIREFSIKQIDPFLYRGLPGLVQAVVVALPWFGESIAVMSLVPHLKHPRHAYRWLAIGGVAAIFAITLPVAQALLIFGSELPERFIFPIYYMMHMISIAKLVERVEVVLVIFWISGMFIKASLYLFISAEAAGHVLGLKTHRWAAVTLAAVGVLLSQMWHSVLDLIYWNSTPGSIILLLSLEIGIPVLLLVGSMVHQAVKGWGSAHA